jgi:hypothetical protein
LLTCGACNFSPWFGGWRVEWFDFASLTLLFFSILSRGFSKFLQRETKFLGWFLDRSIGVCYHQRLLNEPQLPTRWLVCGALGRISVRLTCAT